MSDDFPTADGFEVAGDDTRPGEPLYPGEHTILDRDGDALTEGETVQVWVEAWEDGYGEKVLTGRLQIIGDGGDGGEGPENGDVIAIPDEQSPLEAEHVYRLAGDLSTLQRGVVVSRPSYDTDAGELTITREVHVRGHRKRPVLEARTLGGHADWDLSNAGGL